MFLVLGITGNTGSAAAVRLQQGGHRLRALVRDPGKAAHWAAQGVELVAGELGDAEALARAFDGVEGAYAMIPPELDHPEPIEAYARVARDMASAARATGLRRMVFLSSQAAHRDSGTGMILALHAAEEALRGAVPTLTFLRPAFFQENWRPVLDIAAADGVMPTMFEDLDHAHPMVAAADIGTTAASLLTEAVPHPVVELEGPARYSARDVARAMSAATGREVRPLQPPRAAWEDIMVESGVARPYARLLAEMYDGINAGRTSFENVPDTRRGRLGISDTLAGWRARPAA